MKRKIKTGWRLSKGTMAQRRHRLNNARHRSELAFVEELKARNVTSGYLRNYRLIERYFGDFVWRKIGLVVEIDGGMHADPDVYAWDVKRDREIRSVGYTVVRLSYPFSKKQLSKFFDEWLSELLRVRRKRDMVNFQHEQKEIKDCEAPRKRTEKTFSS